MLSFGSDMGRLWMPIGATLISLLSSGCDVSLEGKVASGLNIGGAPRSDLRSPDAKFHSESEYLKRVRMLLEDGQFQSARALLDVYKTDDTGDLQEAWYLRALSEKMQKDNSDEWDRRKREKQLYHAVEMYVEIGGEKSRVWEFFHVFKGEIAPKTDDPVMNTLINFWEAAKEGDEERLESSSPTLRRAMDEANTNMFNIRKGRKYDTLCEYALKTNDPHKLSIMPLITIRYHEPQGMSMRTVHLIENNGILNGYTTDYSVGQGQVWR